MGLQVGMMPQLNPGDLVILNVAYDFKHRAERAGDLCVLVQCYSAAGVWKVIHGRTGLQFDVHEYYLDKVEGA